MSRTYGPLKMKFCPLFFAVLGYFVRNVLEGSKVEAHRSEDPPTPSWFHTGLHISPRVIRVRLRKVVEDKQHTPRIGEKALITPSESFYEAFLG